MVKKVVRRLRARAGLLYCMSALSAIGFSSPQVLHAQTPIVGNQASKDGVNAPLVLERSIVIPDVPLWPYADHIFIDAANQRVFATPQGSKAVAVLDLKSGRVLKMMTDFSNPHGIYYHPQLKRLFVSDGVKSDMQVYSGDDYSLIKTIPLGPGADALVYDPSSKLIYVANGQKAGKAHSAITAIDPIGMKKVADIPIDTDDFEGLAIDPDKDLLYVSLDEDFAVGVVDVKNRRVVDTWKMPAGNHSPFAIAVDTEHHRLYVACRDDVHGTAMRGSIVVLDTTNGRTVATLPIGGWADGISIDNKRQRIYVSAGVGQIDTYSIGPNDEYRRLSPVETSLLGKTGDYSADLDRMFVSVPQLGLSPALLMVFKPLP